MKASELINKAKTRQDCKAAELARMVGASSGRMSEWEADKNRPKGLQAAQLAELAGLDPWETICALEEEWASKAAEKTAWQGFLMAARSRASLVAKKAATGLKVAVALIAALVLLGGEPKRSTALEGAV